MANSDLVPFAPQDVAHPGAMVQEYLEAFDWSQRELARRTGLTPKTISEICSFKAPISANTAIVFERAFNRPAHLWMNLQRRYEEHCARRDEQQKSTGWREWSKLFPVKAMKQRGWLDAPAGDSSSADSLLRFFGVATPERWSVLWEDGAIQYRQTRKFSTSIFSISAWARQTELLAQKIETQPFDEDKLIGLLPAVRRLTRKQPDEFQPRLEELCASAGVAVVWVPELPKTGISGCARWLTKRKALVALTLRYKWEDQIWFTFFHELGHVLLHRKRSTFILDNADEDVSDYVVDPEVQQQEEEANRFAADTILPPRDLKVFIDLGVFTTNAILLFAKKQEIAPGLVVGRLQREGLLRPEQGNKLKRRFDWVVEHDEGAAMS